MGRQGRRMLPVRNFLPVEPAPWSFLSKGFSGEKRLTWAADLSVFCAILLNQRSFL